MNPANPPLAFYIGHDGEDSAFRIAAIARYLPERPLILTSGSQRDAWHHAQVTRLIQLPPEQPSGSGDPETDEFFFAPVPSATMAARATALSVFFAEEKPPLVVIDRSSAVALQARLSGVPTVFVRRYGAGEEVSRLALRSAEFLFAPYPPFLEDPETPEWIIAKTLYLGGLSRFTGEELTTRTEARKWLEISLEREVVLLVHGPDGAAPPLAELREIAQSQPEILWLCLGHSAQNPGDLPENLRLEGWQNSPLLHLAAADLVFSDGCPRTVMEAGEFRRKLLAFPGTEPTPRAQRRTTALQHHGLAHHVEAWPDSAATWSRHLEAARQLDPAAWDRVFSGNSAIRAAEALVQYVENPGSIPGLTHEHWNDSPAQSEEV